MSYSQINPFPNTSKFDGNESHYFSNVPYCSRNVLYARKEVTMNFLITHKSFTYQNLDALVMVVVLLKHVVRILLEIYILLWVSRTIKGFQPVDQKGHFLLLPIHMYQKSLPWIHGLQLLSSQCWQKEIWIIISLIHTYHITFLSYDQTHHDIILIYFFVLGTF